MNKDGGLGSGREAVVEKWLKSNLYAEGKDQFGQVGSGRRRRELNCKMLGRIPRRDLTLG